jgi:YwiC-like protein
VLPREHGAYGQLLFPVATAIAIGRPTVAALALSAAAVAAFLAHEPALVLLGQRGLRAAREDRPRARRWFLAAAIVSAVCAAIGNVTMTAPQRVSLVPPAVLAGVVVVVVVSQRERTMLGERLIAVTFASIAGPVAVAAGATPIAAWTCAAVFAAGTVSATACIRAVIEATRHAPATASRVVGGLVAAVAFAVPAVLARRGALAPIAPWAAAPLTLAAISLAVFAPSARRLRIVGWSLIAATAATAAILIASLR